MTEASNTGAASGASTTSLADAALRYVPLTVPLLPRSKSPVLNDWPAWQATRDAVVAWWRERPDDNVGVRTGGGLAIIDVDPRAGGDDNLADLEHEHGELPATITVLSGGHDGGRHLWYRAREDLETFTLAAGVQVRARARTGAAQQCVAPPSVHPETGREYCFQEARGLGEIQIAPLPGWMYADHTRTRASTSTGEWVKCLGHDLLPGDRHPTLMSLAGHLLAKRVDPYVALVLLAAFNDRCCQPPKPMREVVEIVEWAARRDGRPGWS